MAVAFENNTDLAFDTDVIRTAAQEYQEIAEELRSMAASLDGLLADLESNGWTSPAGTVFHDMTKNNWEKNIEKYAALLDTLNTVLNKAASEYDGLMVDYVRTTRVKL